MKIKAVQIGEFLKSLNNAEYEYLKMVINIRNGIDSLINDHSMSKEDICKSFDLKEDAYANFIGGNYAYTISHMATINHLLLTYHIDKMKDNPRFKVTK